MAEFAALAKRIRVVLVNTQHSGNIGAAARAMKTMGLRRLVLVDPVAFPSHEASYRAVHAQDLLIAATVVPTLADAVADCTFILGTSVRERRLALPLLDAREAAGLAMQAAGQEEVAIVFGRETSGLSDAELLLCNRQLCIPTDPDYRSLNLAMAVQIVAYELRMAAAPAMGPRPRMPANALEDVGEDDDRPATVNELLHLLRHAESTFTDVGYHDPARPRLLLPRLQRLFARARLLASEARLLRGALSAIDRSLAARSATPASGEPLQGPDRVAAQAETSRPE